MSNMKIELLFTQQGRKLLSSKEHSLLRTTRHLYWIQDGPAELFYISSHDNSDNFVGQRKIHRGERIFLLEVPRGSMLFSFPPLMASAHADLIVAPSLAAKIWEIELTTFLSAIDQDESLATTYLKEEKKWVSNLFTWLQRQNVTLKQIFNTPEEQNHYLICSKMISSTEDSLVIAKQEVDEALYAFNDQVLRLLLSQYRVRELEDRAQLSLRRARQERSLRRATDNTLKLFDAEEYQDKNSYQKEICTVSQMVCDKLAIPYVEPKMMPSEGYGAQVDAIAKSSKFYERAGFLPKHWWQKDCGVLLAKYIDEEEEKLSFGVLEPSASNGYALIAANGLRTVVDEQLAKAISPVVQKFYRSLDREKSVTPFKLLQFGFFGRARDIIIVIMSSLLSTLSFLFFPLTLILFFNFVATSSDISLFWQAMFGLSVALIANLIFIITRETSFLRIESYVSYDSIVAFWHRFISLPQTYFNRISTGELVARVEAIESIRHLFFGPLGRFALNLVFSLFYFILLSWCSPLLALIAFASFLLFTAISIVLFWRYHNVDQQLENLKEKFILQIDETAQGIEVIKNHHAEKTFFARNWELFLKTKQLEIEQGNYRKILDTISAIFPGVTFLFIFIAIIMALRSGEDLGLTSGNYIAFTFIFVTFYSLLFDIHAFAFQAVDLFLHWRKGATMKNTQEGIQEVKHRVGSLAGKIVVDHVYLRYPGQREYANEDISLYALPGEFVGIMGPMGSGKSTLLRMLLNFQRPDEGNIYYDDIDLKEIEYDDIGKKVGVVLESSQLIAGSLAENVSFGQKVTREEITKALRLTCFMDDLQILPQGMDTPLSVDGAQLSTGQRQKILLARAIVGSPKVLILDDPISALDEATQDAIINNIANLNVTCILVTNRLENLAKTQRIYRLEKGMVKV